MPEDVVVAYRSPSKRRGFSQIANVVIEDKEISDGAFRLYALLHDYARRADSVTTSQERIGSDLGKDVRTVRRLIGELHRRGLVGVQRQGLTRPNIYFIEDEYALYDAERPAVKDRVRRTANPDAQDARPTKDAGPDKNVRSGSDRTKMSTQQGQKSPVSADKNVRLLKNRNQEEEKNARGPDLPSAGSEPPNPVEVLQRVGALHPTFINDLERKRREMRGG